MFGSPKCPSCGESVNKQARFCPHCGVALPGGLIRCGQCGAENNADAKFCKSCGQPMSQAAAPAIYGHRWTRAAGDFAVRVEAEDLPGIMRQGIKVEPGTNAMLIERGVNRGMVPPGEHTLGSLGQRFVDWLGSHPPERVTILLVDIIPTEFVFNMGGIFTKDPLRIGASVRLMVEVADPGKFLVNMLKGRERLSQEDLRQYLYPEIAQAADSFIRRRTVQELTEDVNVNALFEQAIEMALQTTFGQSGLRFLNVRTVELNLEHLDQIKGIRSKYMLQVAERKADADGKLALFDVETGSQISQAEADLKARQRFAAINAEVDLHQMAEDTRKVELEERRLEINQRMRAALMTEKINDVRTTADFELFMDGVDRDKLLREKERTELLKTWQEASQDHDRARAHLLAKLNIEQGFERRLAELKLQQDFDTGKLDGEIEIARKRADYEFEMQRKTVDEELRLEQERFRIATDRQKAQLELDRLQREQERGQDEADAMLGMKLLAQMKEIRRLDNEETLRIQRVNELERARGLQELELQKMEVVERQRVAEREYELRRMDALGKAGTEALISLSGPEQARILADLKNMETFKSMTEDQILALAAKDSPEVAHALAEKFRAVAEGNASQREQEMYERLVTEQKAALQMLREENDKRMRDVDSANLRAQQSTERAMDRLSETAQAFARGQGSAPVVVVPGAAGPQVISTGAGSLSAQVGTKSCPNCGRFVAAESRHCEHCGHKFEGVA